jgi:hypothetical protein
MRFTTARLCGGKALMAISAEPLDIDMNKAAELLKKEGCTIKEQDEMILVYEWQGMEVPLYPQGKVMYMPLSDRGHCISYATALLEKLR